MAVPARASCTGAAWLSSARVVRCWVKSRNERNLAFSCHRVWLGTLKELPVTSRRKVGMTSSPHGPYVLGYTRATMAVTAGCQVARPSRSQKAVSVQIALCNSGA